MCQRRQNYVLSTSSGAHWRNGCTDYGSRSPYRGARGSGLNYSQINVDRLPLRRLLIFMFHAQTALLLAEATKGMGRWWRDARQELL